jgi:REP-associated tyrosine transposase
MSRPKRINLPYCLYHVLSRTNSGDLAFYDDKDINKFLGYLAKYADLFSFRIHAWCFMSNHIHLLIESHERPALSELMRRLLTAYTVYFNRRHFRHGHLFQGRFKSFVVDKSGYLLALSRYIHLNPAKMKSPVDPVEFYGSSMKYYAKGGEPPFLSTKEILSWFKGDRKKYINFVNEGLNENTTPETLNQRYIGNEAFAKRMTLRMGSAEKMSPKSSLAEIKTEQFLKDKNEEKVAAIVNLVSEYYNISSDAIRTKLGFKGEYLKARRILICLLLECVPWTHGEVAEYLNFSNQNSVSYHLKKLRESNELKLTLKEIIKQLH